MTSRKKIAKPVKKKGPLKAAKKTASKRVVKKAVAKKIIAKKKAVTKKGSAVKKKAKVITRKPATRLKKAGIPAKKAARKAATNSSLKPKRKKLIKEKAVENIVEANLPPVEEKSREVQNTAPVTPADNIKSMQKAAVRNYDNHHLRLSNLRRGGIKPSGKKPLW